jgi:hypothetical protein
LTFCSSVASVTQDQGQKRGPVQLHSIRECTLGDTWKKVAG